ncbi:AAA family ATPase [Synechococcus sp. CBW1107]|uniref:AAA family ATPase n=1 Tax=Synechococcus sp. CBW1107 TaxID=2789857 RepID=UPI002AD28071|nr:AAA family ATPase [Synechococcus sp. CBW1107]
MAPLRCHLLIGPPASGKTTLARALAPLLSGPGQPPAVVLSTDAIRAEVFGDAAVQGPWGDIQQRLHQRLQEAVANGSPVIVDATHARRAWRLAITQALSLPVAVEWIGWWLHTPLPTCLEWNQRRERPVPVPVIQEMAAALADSHAGPQRSEGFAAICALVPSHHDDLVPVLQSELAGLDKRIRSSRNRENRLQRHGYSRLLDLERLLHLIRLLVSFPDLEASDPGTREELEAWVSPPPQGDLAERAAAYLRRLHGDCYADAAALRRDLLWLEQNGFTSAVAVDAPIQLLEPGPADQPLRRPAVPASGGVHGGSPPMADGPVFLRVMTLLRHMLQAPFDRAGEKGSNLHQHLIAQIEAIPGAYLRGESATLRKDIEKILTPYGFRSRNDNVRHGYCLGTAILSAARLREVHDVVRQAAGRLADPSAQELLTELDERLGWAGLDISEALPVRSYARHSILEAALVRRESLAAPRQAERIETAILEHRRVCLERFASAGSFPESPQGILRVWPLQLIFHNIGWYLLYEDDQVGQVEGLIRSERLDRLALTRSEGRLRRSPEEHRRSLQRVERLLHHCGGIDFGEELAPQLAIASSSARLRDTALETLRFSCTASAFAFIREGVARYPIEHTRFSLPLAGDRWWRHPKAPHVLRPNAKDDSHPYPVELDLPSWTVARDVDLRNWLFGFGGELRIEAPDGMRQELLRHVRAALAVYGETDAAPPRKAAGAAEPSRRQPEAPQFFFSNRCLRD